MQWWNISRRRVRVEALVHVVHGTRLIKRPRCSGSSRVNDEVVTASASDSGKNRRRDRSLRSLPGNKFAEQEFVSLRQTAWKEFEDGFGSPNRCLFRELFNAVCAGCAVA